MLNQVLLTISVWMVQIRAVALPQPVARRLSRFRSVTRLRLAKRLLMNRI